MSNEQKSRILHSSEANGNGHHVNYTGGDARIEMREETYSSSQEDIKKLQNDTILKRIPVGAEATTVLVSIEFFIVIINFAAQSMKSSNFFLYLHLKGGCS